MAELGCSVEEAVEGAADALSVGGEEGMGEGTVAEVVFGVEDEPLGTGYACFFGGEPSGRGRAGCAVAGGIEIHILARGAAADTSSEDLVIRTGIVSRQLVFQSKIVHPESQGGQNGKGQKICLLHY